MFGARVLINILSLVRKDLGVDETEPAYSTAKFVHPSTEKNTGAVGATSLGTDVGTSTSGTITVDSGLGTGTHFSTASGSSGVTLSQGAISMCATGIEEVLRAGGDDIEKGCD